jgi:hypothetical protein
MSGDSRPINLMVSRKLSNYRDHVYGVVRTVAASLALLRGASILVRRRKRHRRHPTNLDETIGIEAPVSLIQSCLVHRSRCPAVINHTVWA